MANPEHYLNLLVAMHHDLINLMSLNLHHVCLSCLNLQTDRKKCKSPATFNKFINNVCLVYDCIRIERMWDKRRGWNAGEGCKGWDVVHDTSVAAAEGQKQVMP